MDAIIGGTKEISKWLQKLAKAFSRRAKKETRYGPNNIRKPSSWDIIKKYLS